MKQEAWKALWKKGTTRTTTDKEHLKVDVVMLENIVLKAIDLRNTWDVWRQPRMKFQTSEYLTLIILSRLMELSEAEVVSLPEGHAFSS